MISRILAEPVLAALIGAIFTAIPLVLAYYRQAKKDRIDGAAALLELRHRIQVEDLAMILARMERKAEELEEEREERRRLDRENAQLRLDAKAERKRRRLAELKVEELAARVAELESQVEELKGSQQ